MSIEEMNPAASARYYERLELAYGRKGNTAMAAAMRSKRLAAIGLEEYDEEPASSLSPAALAAAAAPVATGWPSGYQPIEIIDAAPPEAWTANSAAAKVPESPPATSWAPVPIIHGAKAEDAPAADWSVPTYSAPAPTVRPYQEIEVLF